MGTDSNKQALTAKPGNVARNAVLAVAQVVVTGAVLFLLYRYLLNVIGAERVGVWSIVLATTTASRISELGFAGGATKFVAAANARHEPEKASETVQTALLTIGVILALALELVYLVGESLLSLIVPSAAMTEAITILPYAIMSVWLSGIGGVLNASLDGCQRADIRSVVAMLGGLVYLALVWSLTPRYGLTGLGVAQVGQALLLLLTSWVLLRRQMPSLPIVPLCWRASLFKEMFQYSVKFQLISIFLMLYEPLTKAFVTKFGGLAATAYFEMANRMVRQFRSLIVAANQVMVPKIAATHETDPALIPKSYLETYRVVFFLTFPLYAIVLCATPFIGLMWVGHHESNFLLFVALIASGFVANTLAAPAYFVNLGTGKLGWNVVAHAVLGVMTALLGFVFGRAYGAGGAVAGSVVALGAASAMIIWAFHRDYTVPFRALIPRETVVLLLGATAVSAFTMTFPLLLDRGWPPLEVAIAIALSGPAIILPLAWRHPLRSRLAARIAGSFKRRDNAV